MRFAAAATLLLVVSLSIASAQSNNEAKKHYNEGNKLLKSGDFAGAIGQYDAALKLENHEFFWYQKGLALRNSKKEGDAVEAFRKSIETNPKFAPGYNALAGGYFALKDYDKAIENYEKALAEKPTLGQAKVGLAAAQTAKAVAMVNGGDSRNAIALAQSAIQHDPKYMQAHIVLAQAYNKEAKYGDAIKAGEAALKVSKGTGKGAAWFEIGLAHRNQGNMGEAKKAFLEAKKDPQYARNAEYEIKQLK